jgi:cobalt-zinc-cadmium efflux system membrane fusion protein
MQQLPRARQGLWMALVLPLVFAACAKQEEASAKAKASTKTAASPVELAAAQKPFLTVEAVSGSQAAGVLPLPGRVTFRPQSQSAIGATVPGRVVAVLVRAGEAVKAGAPLLTIESADAAAARAALDQGATRLAAAESVYRRTVEMMEKGVGLEVERQEAEARVKDARTEHERARQAVNVVGAGQGTRVTVRAPVNGVVISIRVAVGATVAPGGEALLELGDPTRLQVIAQAAESDLSRVAAGQSAEVELPALSMRVPAKVESFSPRVDPESRRAQVYLDLAKLPEGLRAGMLAQVAVRTAAESGIRLPVTAVVIKEGRRRVVYLEKPDGTFEARDVKTGRNQDGWVVILEGLTPGDRVVTRGALLLDTQAEQLL